MDGKVLQMDDHCTISFERYLKHPVERVWRAISNPEQMSKWLTVNSEMEWKMEGQLVFRWENGDFVEGKFTKIELPYELEYTWKEQTSGYSLVRWRLKNEDGGCRLDLTHSFYESAVVPYFLAGWHVHLDVLDVVLNE